MKSSELEGWIRGNIKVGDSALNISPEEIYLAANFAQNEIFARLRPITRRGQIALISGQEEYAYSKLTITAVGLTAPLQITVTAHGLDTGDMVTIREVTGISSTATANGRWVITKVDANNFTLNGSVTITGAPTGGYVYPELLFAFSVDRISRSDTPFGTYEKLSDEQFEEKRRAFDIQTGATSDPTQGGVVYWTEVLEEEGLRLLFLNKPEGTFAARIKYARFPAEPEQISATVDPILPARLYDALLLQGTLYYALDKSNNEIARQRSKEEAVKFEAKLAEMEKATNVRRLIRRSKPKRMVWI